MYISLRIFTSFDLDFRSEMKSRTSISVTKACSRIRTPVFTFLKIKADNVQVLAVEQKIVFVDM